ncbi:ATP-binding protein [Nonomuraea diastatica]|uniref:Histidine kinase n=1 Tax=Nonomuraea diastatica TaxID=1848329 RepID=A0A4R4WJV9_9ACTN|nr:ATP-binding protein [Nonomuraea diastatica]TDD17767.1 histidine kinase [Nonomuraea diastatica]
MPPDSFSVPMVIGVAVLVLALAGILVLYLRVRGRLAQAHGRLAQTRQAQDRLARESSAWSQRLLQAERKAQENADLLRETRAQHDLVRAETDHLISKRIPALLSHLRAPHVIVPGMQNQALAGTDLDRQHRAILDALTRGIREETERIDEAAQAVIRGAMSRVQTQALRAQDLLAGVQQRYSGDEHTALLREVLGLDMFNELVIRRMQVTGIACGATPGLSRDDTYLVDLVVGAVSRVENFELRIDGPANHLRRRIGVAARAAESILFITAELLANAVHHSHGTLKVSIAVHETNNGAAIVIDDAGVGLNEDQYARAGRLLSGNHPVRLVDLGNPPRTGWAAIGRQVAHYGMQVTVKKSAFGGVQAVLNIPTALLVEMPEDSRPSVLAPEPVRAVAPAATAIRRGSVAAATAVQQGPVAVPTVRQEPVAAPRPEPVTSSARPEPATAPQQRPAEDLAPLPQRRRQQPRATSSTTTTTGGGPDGTGGRLLTTPEEAQKRWGDFQVGAEAGRREALPTEQHDITEGK